MSAIPAGTTIAFTSVLKQKNAERGVAETQRDFLEKSSFSKKTLCVSATPRLCV